MYYELKIYHTQIIFLFDYLNNLIFEKHFFTQNFGPTKVLQYNEKDNKPNIKDMLTPKRLRINQKNI